jgi:hypothetical protein
MRLVASADKANGRRGGVMRACYRKCCPISRQSTVSGIHMLPNKPHRLTEFSGNWMLPVAKSYSIP